MVKKQIKIKKCCCLVGGEHCEHCKFYRVKQNRPRLADTRIDLNDYERGLNNLREAREVLEKIVGEPALKFIDLAISETLRDYECMADLIYEEKDKIAAKE